MHSMKIARRGNLVYSFEQTNPQVAVGYATDGKFLVKGTAKFSNDFVARPDVLQEVFYKSATEALNRKHPKQTRFHFVNYPKMHAMTQVDPDEMITLEQININVEWTIKQLGAQHPLDIVRYDLSPLLGEYSNIEVSIEEDPTYMQFKITVQVGKNSESSTFTAEYLSQQNAFQHAVEFLAQKADGEKPVFHTGGVVNSNPSTGAGETMRLLNELFDLSQRVRYCKTHGVLCSCDGKTEVSLRNAVIYMNDSLHKTRNEIADALEALDLDLEIKGDVKTPQITGG